MMLNLLPFATKRLRIRVLLLMNPRLMLYSFIRVKAGSDIMGVVDHIRKTVAQLRSHISL